MLLNPALLSSSPCLVSYCTRNGLSSDPVSFVCVVVTGLITKMTNTEPRMEVDMHEENDQEELVYLGRRINQV